jgi:hypothetical protein
LRELRSSAMRIAVFLIAAFVGLTAAVSGHRVAASEPPAAPSELTWTPTAVTWQDNSDDEDGFRLEKLIFGEWLFAAQYAADTTSGPHPSLTYDVGCVIPMRLIAFNDSGDSDPSGPIAYVPVPTAPPSGCPFTDTLTFTNDTGLTANKLVLADPLGYQTLTLSANAPGCPQPTVALSTSPYAFEVSWPVSCVDPGESVVLIGTGTGPSAYLHGEWSQETSATPSPTPSASPTPTPTPAASASPTVTPASLPIAGGPPGSGQTAVLALATGAIFLLVAAIAFKRIR